MILSDREIRLEIDAGYIKFEPPIDQDIQIQDASVDLRLGRQIRVPEHLQGEILAPFERIRPDRVGREETISAGGYNLRPHDFLLAQTLER